MFSLSHVRSPEGERVAEGKSSSAPHPVPAEQSKHHHSLQLLWEQTWGPAHRNQHPRVPLRSPLEMLWFLGALSSLTSFGAYTGEHLELLGHSLEAPPSVKSALEKDEDEKETILFNLLYILPKSNTIKINSSGFQSVFINFQ